MNVTRKGIALLWVMLTSALILVGIVGVSMKVIPQKKIENSRQYTQRALAVAESGLAETTYKLRTDTALQSTLQSGSQPYDSQYVFYNSGVAASGQYDSAYRVIIKATGTEYTFYSLGTLYSQSFTDSSSSSSTEPATTVLARQAITVQYSLNFPIGEYGLLTNSTVQVQGGRIDGNIYASQVIFGNTQGTGQGPDFVDGNMVYVPAQGGATIGVPPGDYTPVSQIFVPSIPFETYRGYWNDFLNGTGYYDGTHTGYPNTSTATVHTWLIHTLGFEAGEYTPLPDGSYPAAYQSATVGTPRRQVGFDVLFGELQGATDASTPAGYLRGFLTGGSMVFDIKPSEHASAVDFGGNATPSFSTEPFLEGTVVIEGDLKLAGGTQIGVLPKNTEVLVTGNVESTGTGSQGTTLNGMLYVDGYGRQGQDSLSVRGAGGLTVNGSIVAQYDIKLNSGCLSVTYRQNDVYDVEVKDILEHDRRFNPVPSSWQQISYDEFRTAAGDY